MLSGVAHYMVMKRGQLTRESKVQLERTEMRKVRWMCGKKLQDRVTSAELRHDGYRYQNRFTVRKIAMVW